MDRNSRNNSPEALAKARKFRREMTVSEKWFWHRVRDQKLGIKFRRQVAIGPYALDFYCPQASLCVEIDGEQHLSRVDADGRRDAYLAERGIETIRIPSLELFDDTAIALGRHLDLIVQRCDERSK